MNTTAMSSPIEAVKFESVNDQMERFLKKHLPDFEPPKNPKTWPAQARKLRKTLLDKVYLRGWSKELVTRKPPTVWGDEIKPCKEYTIKKLRYEIFPDFWIPALLYVPTNLKRKAPVVLCPNGHHHSGKAIDYKQARCANLARRGMIVMNFEFIGMGELMGDWPHCDRGIIDLTDVSYTGFFYMAMSKALDILLAQPKADPTRCLCTGLSGGGWQTIVLTALDERITHSLPVSGYMSMKSRLAYSPDIGDWEQTPPDLGLYADYQLMTAMVAPRPMLQILNANDECCFRTDRAKKDIHDDLRCVWDMFGAGDDFMFYNNTDPGTHNYDEDNRDQLYKFCNKYFGLDTPMGDLHGPDEIFTEFDLDVGLPVTQKTLLEVARQRARELVVTIPMPKTATQKKALRKKIADRIRLVNFPTYKATKVGKDDGADLFAIKAGAWEFPAATAKVSSEKRGEMYFSTNPADHAMFLATQARGICTVADVFGLGRMAGNTGYQMMMKAAGQFDLGLAVGQMLAAVRFGKKQAGVRKLHVTGYGWLATTMMTFAAALEPQHFASISMNANFNSFQHMCDQCLNHYEIQALLCPELLTFVDVRQLYALAEGVEIHQPGRAAPVVIGG